MEIRRSEPGDLERVRVILQQVVEDGTSYAQKTVDALLAYFQSGDLFVATADAVVVGLYVLKPNQPGRGSHVANAGYAVDTSARGAGVGRAMLAHSLEEARRLGFTAMQYNLVVSTNPAVRLWEAFGFAIVGTIPRAFDHPELGPVDAFVMHRSL